MSPSILDTQDSVYIKCATEDADQRVCISHHRIGRQQDRNKETLKGQQKGDILDAITKLSQNSPDLRICDNWGS